MLFKHYILLLAVMASIYFARGQPLMGGIRMEEDESPETRMPRNCDDLYRKRVNYSGEYYIQAKGVMRKVYCRMHEPVTQKNWLVIQRRISADLDFQRNWNNYTDGFGDMSEGNFWLGLEKIHAITSTGDYLLRLELMDFQNQTSWVESNHFFIHDDKDFYKFNVSTNKKDHRGTAGQIHRSFMYINGMPFSTVDQDHDQWSGNCAAARKGGWWFNRCTYINMNGRYVTDGGDPWVHEGVYWYWLKRSTYSLKKVEMMIRPIF